MERIIVGNRISTVSSPDKNGVVVESSERDSAAILILRRVPVGRLGLDTDK